MEGFKQYFLYKVHIEHSMSPMREQPCGDADERVRSG